MFLQYLWGIETRSASLRSFNTKGFYSTYEELKPQPLHFFVKGFYCFYSTYEELKL